MRDIKAFLIENGFEHSNGVRVSRENGFIQVLRPCGIHNPQPFRCQDIHELPIAILKQRPVKMKAIATLVLLPDETAYYRRGGLSASLRNAFEELGVDIEKHVRGPSEVGYGVSVI